MSCNYTFKITVKKGKESNQRELFAIKEMEKEGLDEVRFMVDVNLMGISNMLKEAFPTMKNWRDCGSCPPRPVK